MNNNLCNINGKKRAERVLVKDGKREGDLLRITRSEQKLGSTERRNYI